MRTAKKTVPTLDLFRLAAVLLVVMNHTSPPGGCVCHG